MGCCETRYVPDIKPINDVSDLKEEEENDYEFFVKYKTNFEDSKAKEIENYINKLLTSDDWTTHLENKDYTVKTKLGSIFDENTPVCLMILNMNISISLGKIFNLLFWPDIRKSWDTKIEFMEVLNSMENSLRIIKQYPFKPLEFVIKLNCVKRKGTATALFYSEEFPFINENAHRSQCYFGMVKIIRNRKSTVIVIVQQEEYERGNLNERCTLIASESVQWLQVLRKHLYQSVFY